MIDIIFEKQFKYIIRYVLIAIGLCGFMSALVFVESHSEDGYDLDGHDATLDCQSLFFPTENGNGGSEQCTITIPNFIDDLDKIQPLDAALNVFREHVNSLTSFVSDSMTNYFCPYNFLVF